MRAGLLNQKIDIERSTDSRDEWGDTSESWAAIASNIPASISPIRMKEFIRSAETQTELTHKVIIRYSSDVSGITAKDRVKHGSDYYDIRGVINVNKRNRMLELMCVERA